MRWRVVWHVLVTELRLHLRERRLVALLLLVPLVVEPFAAWVGPRIVDKLVRPHEDACVTVSADRDNVVGAALAHAGLRVQQGEACMTVLVDETGTLAADGNATVTLRYDPLARGSAATATRVRAALLDVAHELATARLAHRGLSARLTEPITVIDASADSPRVGGDRRGRAFGALIVIALLGLAAAQGTDALAGERERGTLAALLDAGVRGTEVVLGKSLAVAGVTATGVLAGALVGWLLARDGSWQHIGALATMTMTGAVLTAALVITMSAWSRSVREAQALAELIHVPLFLACGAACFPGIVPTVKLAALPLFGTVVTSRALFTDGVAAGLLAVNTASTLLVALVLLVLAGRRLDRG